MSCAPGMSGQDDDGFLDWLQERNVYADGLRDGYHGEGISEEQFGRSEYRRGLQHGRTQRIDEHLRALSEGGEAFALRRYDDAT